MRTTTVASVILLIAGIGEVAVRASGAQATSSTKASPAAFNACTLLTAQEAAAAVGEAVGEPKPIAPGRGAMPGVDIAACQYESAAGNSIQVSVWHFAESAGQFRQFYQAAIAKKEQVPGLGERAAWYNAQHDELQVLKGAILLVFEIHRSGNATEALTTVAKKALTRLP